MDQSITFDIERFRGVVGIQEAIACSREKLAACRRVGLCSMIVIPIPHRGQTVGMLKYHAPEPRLNRFD